MIQSLWLVTLVVVSQYGEGSWSSAREGLQGAFSRCSGLGQKSRKFNDREASSELLVLLQAAAADVPWCHPSLLLSVETSQGLWLDHILCPENIPSSQGFVRRNPLLLTWSTRQPLNSWAPFFYSCAPPSKNLGTMRVKVRETISPLPNSSCLTFQPC